MIYPDTFKYRYLATVKFRSPAISVHPAKSVFDTFTKPDLVRRWLLGPPGWTMPVCEIDLKAGGRYRLCVEQARRQQYGDGRHVSRSRAARTDRSHGEV